jgi:hypothetical protein
MSLLLAVSCAIGLHETHTFLGFLICIPNENGNLICLHFYGCHKTIPTLCTAAIPAFIYNNLMKCSADEWGTYIDGLCLNLCNELTGEDFCTRRSGICIFFMQNLYWTYSITFKIKYLHLRKPNWLVKVGPLNYR